MKKINCAKLSLFFVFAFLLIQSASAIQEACNIQVSLVNQNPLPAIPGDYVEVVFQVSGIDKDVCSGAMLKLNPNYPFSLDEEPQTQILDGTTWVSSNYKTYWTIPYTLRVASDALDGTHELKIIYGEDSLILSKSFNISIEDSRTKFDAVIQEVSSSEASIAIANIGKYTANSVVVRIPQQDNFKATDTDGQMVGSLDSGDYTIVSFAISKTMQRTENKNSSNKLQFDIYYTDALGERRIENMELELNMGNAIATANTEDLENIENIDFAVGQRRQQQSFFSSNYVKGAIFFILIVGIIFLYKRYPKKFKDLKEKIKEKFHKNKKVSNISHELPDWIKNLENSKKKKE